MKPVGITSKTKDNSRKKPYEREQWLKKKREGRPKQRFVDLRGTDMNPADCWWEKLSQ